MLFPSAKIGLLPPPCCRCATRAFIGTTSPTIEATFYRLIGRRPDRPPAPDWCQKQQAFSTSTISRSKPEVKAVAPVTTIRESVASCSSSAMVAQKPGDDHLTVYRGHVIHAVKLGKLECLNPGEIGVNRDGDIVFVRKVNDEGVKAHLSDTTTVIDLGQRLLIPGFVDGHAHAPQASFAGLGMELQLLDWLNTYTFPRESKFRDLQYAEDVYRKAVKRHITCGTTTCSYFATIHLEASKLLCDIVKEYGQRGFIGKVNMDRNSPDYYIEKTEESIRNTRLFVDYVIKQDNQKGLVTPVITPRFVPSVTPALMTELAKISREHAPLLPIQSHMGENPKECSWVKELHPEAESYAATYDQYGLIHERTYMAHCIYCSKDERQILASRRAGVIHCPNSNFHLSSGVLNVKRLLSENIKVGLGTDVSGGYSSSILDAIRSALTASKLVSIDHDSLQEPQQDGSPSEWESLTVEEAFYLATLGGAECLGIADKIGNFMTGKSFDALVINTRVPNSPIDIYVEDTPQDEFHKFMFNGDDRNIEAVYVAGRKIK